MGLMDRVKEQANQLAQKTQEAAQEGRARIDQAQAARRGDMLLRQLGALVFAERTGRGTGDSQTQIDQLIGELSAHETQTGLNLTDPQQSGFGIFGQGARGQQAPGQPAPGQREPGQEVHGQQISGQPGSGSAGSGSAGSGSAGIGSAGLRVSRNRAGASRRRAARPRQTPALCLRWTRPPTSSRRPRTTANQSVAGILGSGLLLAGRRADAPAWR